MGRREKSEGPVIDVFKPPGNVLLTSTSVARMLGIGVSSAKRWTDSGKLKSIRTVGGHRRYTLAALHEFAASQNLSGDNLPPLGVERYDPIGGRAGSELIELLLAALIEGDAERVRGYLAQLIPEGDARVEVLDQLLSPLLRQIGLRWESGDLGVDEEHRASYIIADAIDRLRTPVTDGTRVALLACPPGELHELALKMVRLVTEWNGWSTDYLGANLPWRALHEAVVRTKPDLLLLSSKFPEPFSTRAFLDLVDACEQQKTLIGIGGAWARGGNTKRAAATRFRTLKGFQKWLRSIETDREGA